MLYTSHTSIYPDGCCILFFNFHLLCSTQKVKTYIKTLAINTPCILCQVKQLTGSACWVDLTKCQISQVYAYVIYFIFCKFPKLYGRETIIYFVSLKQQLVSLKNIINYNRTHLTSQAIHVIAFAVQVG